MIETVCMDCKKSLGFKDGEGVKGVSHGLCDDCYNKRIKELKSEKSKRS